MKKTILLLILCSCTHYEISREKKSAPVCTETPLISFGDLKYATLEACQNSEEFKMANEPNRVSEIDKYIKDNPDMYIYREAAIKKLVQIGMPEKLVYIAFGKPTNVVINTEEFGVYKKQLDYPGGQIFLHNGYVKSLITPDIK